MKKYELTYIISDKVPEKETDLIIHNVKKIIEKLGGKIIKEDIWGRKKLAYPILGQDYGFYVYNQIELPPNKVSELNSNFKVTEEIVRHLCCLFPLFPEERKPKSKTQSKKSPKASLPAVEKVEDKKLEEEKVKETPKKTEVSKSEKLVAEEKAGEERMAELEDKLKEILGE